MGEGKIEDIEVPLRPDTSEVKVTFLREVFVTSGMSAGQVRSIVHKYSPRFKWRVLHLRKGAFLAVSYTDYFVKDNEIDSDDLHEFAVSSDTELMKMGRVGSIVFGQPFAVSSLPDRFVQVITSSGDILGVRPEHPIEFVDHQVNLQFRLQSVRVLASRPDGVRIFYDGKQSNGYARKISEYFRLFEAGFGLKGGRLSGPLIQFLAGGKFPISVSDWQRLKGLRDKLSHAYKAGEIAYDSDGRGDMSLMQGLAADVLLHKENWGSKDSLRLQENFFATYKALDGTIVIMQGRASPLFARAVDSVTGNPVHLSPQEHNVRYRKYADLFRASLKGIS